MMKNLRICVCDDDSRLLMTYAAAIKGNFQSFGIAADVDTYSSTEHLRARMQSIVYDVIFLDIDMPREDGVTFAKQLRQQQNNVPIIFVSSHEDRMYDTFSVQPFGFVRKGRFVSDLNKTVGQFLAANSELTADMIIFPTQSGGFQVNAKQIIYIESSLHSQYLYMKGQQKFELRLKMESIEKTLSDKGFIRIHKGYIVNYRYIKRIENTEIYLTTGETLPLSRSKKKEVKALWLEYGTKNGFVDLDSMN